MMIKNNRLISASQPMISDSIDQAKSLRVRILHRQMQSERFSLTI